MLGKKSHKHQGLDVGQSCIHFNIVLYMSDGVFIGLSLRILHKMTILPLTQMFTSLLYYKGEVVILHYSRLRSSIWSSFLREILSFDFVDLCSVFLCLRQSMKSNSH
jgi:hypothetical protein